MNTKPVFPNESEYLQKARKAALHTRPEDRAVMNGFIVVGRDKTIESLLGHVGLHTPAAPTHE